VTLIRPLNKGQGHSIWYQLIFSYTTAYRLSLLLQDAPFSHNTFRTDDRQMTDDERRRTQH